jgi:Fe-S cluster biogenesis protein NfuA
MEEKEFQQRIQQIESLVHKIERLDDKQAQASALELFRSIMDLHGAGLERMMSIAFNAGDAGKALINSFAGDDLVSSLLLLYGLHPLDLQERVMAALDKARPYLRQHGGSAELISVSEGAVRLRLEASNQGCGSTAQTLQQALEEAIYDAAPDIVSLQIENETGRLAPVGLVQLEMAQSKKTSAKPAGERSEDFASL